MMVEKKLIMMLVFLCSVAFKGYSQDISYIEKQEKDAAIYPNPLIGDKFIVKSEFGIKKVEIVNVIGKVVNRTENQDFEIGELPILVGKCQKGMYLVKITFYDNKSIIKKLLVK
jgi:hypothetical protein